jgi:hypothetical protein
MKTDLPCGTHFYPTTKKLFSESVLFVPHYGGSLGSMKRHIQMVNDLGFDAYAFPSAKIDKHQVKKFALAPNTKFGLVEIWADQVEQVLNHIEGKKIVFSFSSPSYGVVKALARRNCVDVKAWLCDGGPWYGHAWLSIWNYFTHADPIENPVVKAFASTLTVYLWGFGFQEEYRKELKQFSNEFPVLSIRGWKDPMVPAKNIEAGFEGMDNLDLYVLGLPEAGHLNGLRDFRQEYAPRVKQFLERFANRISK